MTDFHAITPDGEVHLATTTEEGVLVGPDDLLAELAQVQGETDQGCGDPGPSGVR